MASPAGLSRQPTASWWLENGADTDPVGTRDAGAELPACAQTVVIGMGMTGVSCAYFLNLAGQDAVVVDGRGLAGGASGRNGGVLSGSHPFQQRNAAFLRELIAAQGIECESRQQGYLSLALEGDELASELEESSGSGTSLTDEHWDAGRCASELHGTDALDGRLIVGGVFRRTAGHFWPAKAVHALAKACTRTTFCPGTTVLSLTPTDDGVLIRTDRGDVQAARVVVCTNGWSPRLVPALSSVLYPVRNNVIMTAPCKSWSWAGSISTGEGPDEIYAARRPDNRICVGGARRFDPSCGWFTQEWEGPASQPGMDDDSTLSEPAGLRLRAWLSQMLCKFAPVAERPQTVAVEAEWAGVSGCQARDPLGQIWRDRVSHLRSELRATACLQILGFTLDGMPLVGRVPGAGWGGRLLVGAGFNGHGMPVCSGVGEALAAMLSGRRVDPYVLRFDPSRFSVLARATAVAPPPTVPAAPTSTPVADFDPDAVGPGTKAFGYVGVVDTLAVSTKLAVGVVCSAIPGPTLVITAGLFPTEYCGIEAATRLYATTAPVDLKCGRLLIMPVVNLHGLQFRHHGLSLRYRRYILFQDGLCHGSW